MTKLVISPTMVTSLSKGIEGQLTNLFDGKTFTGLFPGWNAENYPAKLKIQFEKPEHITLVKLFDGPGQPNLRFYNGANNQLLLDTKLDGYMTWIERTVDWNVESIILELVDSQGEGVITEIEFYTADEGNPVDPVDPINVPKTKKGASKAIMTNGFHWTPFSIMSVFGGARLYMAHQFVMRDGKFYGDPFYQAGVQHALGLDKYLKDAKVLGIDILLCLNQLPTDWAMEWDGDPEGKPIKRNADPLDPASYHDIAKFYFNLAARYGSIAVDHTLLEVNNELRWGAQNVIKSGLNLLNRVELWNEQWAWWRGEDSRFTPEEYAVMFFMCYNGCNGRFPGCGVAQADPAFELVMGGMSEMNTDHLDRFLNKLIEMGADASIVKYVQFHHYSNKGNDEGYMPKQWTEGASPEADQLEMRLQRMIDWRDARLPNAKLIYGEFGWDTADNGQSWQKSHGEQNQANWLVRTYLLSLKMKIDECYMFNVSDGENYVNGDLWASSGQVGAQSTGYTPKIAHNAIASLIKELNGYDWRKDLSPSENVRILLFKNGRTLKYYYWTVSGTANIIIGNTKLVATEKPEFRTVRAYEPNRIALVNYTEALKA